MVSFDYLGQRIKLIRLQAALTQEAFGQLFGVSKQTVSMWELGAYQPTSDRLQAIADYARRSVYELEQGYEGQVIDSYFYYFWEIHADVEFVWLLPAYAPSLLEEREQVYAYYKQLLQGRKDDLNFLDAFEAFRQAVRYCYSRNKQPVASIQEVLNEELELYCKLNAQEAHLPEIIQATQKYYEKLNQVTGHEEHNFSQDLFFKTLRANIRQGFE